MQVELSPELEARLAAEASRRGLSPSGYAESILIDQLSFVAANRASMALIEQWRREGAVEADPEEIRRSRAEAQAFFKELARDRGYAEADAEAFAAASVAVP